MYFKCVYTYIYIYIYICTFAGQTRIGSDAGGLGFEFQTGRVRGKSIASLWRDKHPAIKGLEPPEHHAGQFHPDQKYSSESKTTNNYVD